MAAAACALATACGAAQGPSSSPSGSGPGSTPSPRPLVAITAADASNGRTITLHVGDSLSVVLHSTYWGFAGSSNSVVLVSDGNPAVSPSPSGCVPGQGCGTVVAAFDANTVGTAVVSASRTTCGEALRCTGSAGSYRLTVKVISRG
jgi:hypothetical protein